MYPGALVQAVLSRRSKELLGSTDGLRVSQNSLKSFVKVKTTLFRGEVYSFHQILKGVEDKKVTNRRELELQDTTNFPLTEMDI